jgi:hypothetical protein
MRVIQLVNLKKSVFLRIQISVVFPQVAQMKSLDFYQVECPKCHGQLNSAAPLSGQTLCPFCGTVYHITANMTQNAEMPEQIVPFATLTDDFAYSAWKMLMDEDYAPVDISGLISFESAKGVYLPVFFYECKYECAWSCKIKQMPVDKDAEKSRKEVYRPQNGVSKGGYSMICLAYEGAESEKELADYVCSLDYSGAGLKPFLPQNLNGCFFLVRNRDSRQTWKHRGEDALNGIIRENTLKQLHHHDVKDFKCDVTSSGTSEGRFIFYPLWMLNYRYDGELHHIFMDGAGRNGIKGTTLIDRTLKDKAEKPFMVLKFIAVAAIVVPFLMLLAGWTLPAIVALPVMGAVFFGYRFYARWHKSRVIRKARKEREKRCKV